MAKKTETKSEASAASSPERNLSGVRSAAGPMGAVAGNQTPVTVTGKQLSAPPVEAEETQAVAGVDGGDGTRTARATKVADNVWTPFRPPEWFEPGDDQWIPKYWYVNGSWQTAPATRTASTTNDTADVAGNALTLY